MVKASPGCAGSPRAVGHALRLPGVCVLWGSWHVGAGADPQAVTHGGPGGMTSALHLPLSLTRGWALLPPRPRLPVLPAAPCRPCGPRPLPPAPAPVYLPLLVSGTAPVQVLSPLCQRFPRASPGYGRSQLEVTSSESPFLISISITTFSG